ncbi:MAG: C1 family peptidase [Ignavibacteria bacterium]|nr:C1 family peptidase [Ignavibacteria bacterium]
MSKKFTGHKSTNSSSVESKDTVQSSGSLKTKYSLTVRADIVDFRDMVYQPSLREVPVEKPLKEYQKLGLPILDQGKEGACTGYGLAAVVNYLLHTRKVTPGKPDASELMLYDSARRYDEWKGENYEGSSARGAMKGWHKHGVAHKNVWEKNKRRLSRSVAIDALSRPLGAYYRVNAKDLIALHCAIEDVGILYATANVHTGWEQVTSKGKDAGLIPYSKEFATIGGHAFAIVGYTKDGLWIQNSWSDKWGKKGFGFITYEDWLKNGNDVWVARLGVPISIPDNSSTHQNLTTPQSRMITSFLMRPHVISIGNNGVLKSDERFHTNALDLQKRFQAGSTFETTTATWKKKRIVLYAHGGLVDESSALHTLSKNIARMLENEAFPVMFVWHSDGVSTIANIVKDSLKEKIGDSGRSMMFDWLTDRYDQTIEVLARPLGKRMWSEMKENAMMATLDNDGFNSLGGGYLFLEQLKALMKRDPSVEVHVVGHSAGAIFLGGFVNYMRENKLPIESCTLWAPACTVDFFHTHYTPSMTIDISGDSHIKRCALFTLSDDQECDDTATMFYRKSLLYLVSNSFEEYATPYNDDFEKILGMEKYAHAYRQSFDIKDKFIWINGGREVKASKFDLRSTATKHGDFDDNIPTLTSTLNFIKG